MMLRKPWPVYKTTASQIGNKLILTDGHNPLRYVDLSTNKVHAYRISKGSKVRNDSAT